MKKISSLMLLALALLLINCRSDQFPEQESHNNSSAFQLTSKRISLDEAKHKAKLLPEIEQVENKFKVSIKKNAQGKLVNYGNGVSIDTDDVIYIQNGPNYYTYTFRINRENASADAPVENLVLSPLSDGSWKETLVTYNFTAQEKQTMLSGGTVNLIGKVTQEILQSGTYSSGIMGKDISDSNCYFMTYSYYTSCSENAHHHGEAADEDGGPCKASVQSVLVVTQALVCPNPGGSLSNPGGNEIGTTPGGFNTSGGGNGSPIDPSGSNGANNPNNPCGGNGIPSQPQDPNSTLGNQSCNNGTVTLPNLSAEHFKFNQLISQLSPALQSWINQPYNAEVYTYFINYFTYNNQSLEAGNFVKWSFNFLYQNQDVTLAQFQNWFIEEPILNNTLQNELFEDWADPTRVKPTTRFKNHAKINGIYNQIKSASNFKQYLQNFEPNFSVAHLRFDIDATQISNALAETSWPTSYWIEITFNKDKDWTNIPKIVIADTFMHEIIHAEIFRKLLSLVPNSNGTLDQNLIKQYVSTHNYAVLFDYYVRKTKGDESWQHQAMAAHYVNIMVNFLKQVYGTNYTETEYKTVVWMGLQGTTAWNLLPQSEKTLYLNTWNTNYWSWEL